MTGSHIKVWKRGVLADTAVLNHNYDRVFKAPRYLPMQHTTEHLMTFKCGIDIIRTVWRPVLLSLICLSLCPRGKRGALCGKQFTFVYTSPHEHVEYNASGP